MKKIFSFAIMALVSCSLVMAQGSDSQGRGKQRRMPTMEEFMQMKLRHIVKELNLNEKDSAAFAPLYTQMFKEKQALMVKYGTDRETMKQLREGKQLADTTLQRITRNGAQLKMEEAQLEVQYLQRFEKVLSPAQIYNYQRAEESFRSRMMKGHHGFNRDGKGKLSGKQGGNRGERPNKKNK